MNLEAETVGSIFQSFNARNLSPTQVAKTFVPPRQFHDLINRQHSVIVGPRGSGKTTLLKMLQLPALAVWQHANADEIRRSIDFTGVFVASDVSWGEQLNNFDGATLPTSLKNVLGRAAFTTHVLDALVDGFRECCSEIVCSVPSLQHQAVRLSRDQEKEIVLSVAAAWKLDVELYSFDALKIALATRMSNLLVIAQRESLSAEEVATRNIQNIEYLHLDTVAALKAGITAFNLIAKCESKKWAFLFDELEIAPREIQRTLHRNLRSGKFDILYKLSLSPFDESFASLESARGPTQRNDYQKIELWYPRKEATYEFSEALVSAMLRDAMPNSSASPQDIFGESEFDAPVGKEKNQTYAPEGKAYDRFKALAGRDKSFQAYLDKHEIDVESMHTLVENRRAETVRRVASIVVVRETYRAYPRGNATAIAAGRSRKNPDIYAGARSLFAIAEGNPRWLMSIFGPLMREIRLTGEPCDRSRQSQEVTAAAHTFRALLASYPFKSQGKNVGLVSLLDRIGKAFYRRVVLEDFTAQPSLSFIIDARCDAEVISALGRALNAGAIIYVSEEDEEPVLKTLRGKRFRLAYSLAAHSKLPLVLGLAANLSKLLEESAEKDMLWDELP